MLSSMTGFGRASSDAPFGRLTVEIQSVNRKYLEIFVSSPKEFAQYDHEVRKWVGESVSRGQITVRIYLEPSLNSVLLPDPKVLKKLKMGWDQVAKKAGVDTKGIDMPFLMQYLPAPKAESSVEELQLGVKEAVRALVAMKQVEGKALAKDLSLRIKELERMVSEVEKHSPDAVQRMRAKLKERMEEAMQGDIDERLLREVAFFAERVDISEEITRFRSHIEQFKGLLKEDVVGRKMDFLLQEMGREVNTIGSKAMDAKIAHLVVAMKSELEKVREQVQNIE